MSEYVKVLINLTPEQKEHALAQPDGMAAYIRNLIDQDIRIAQMLTEREDDGEDND